MRSFLPLLLMTAGFLGGCRSSNTLFPIARTDHPPREYVLDIPDHYDVRSVDFEATTDSSGVAGRGFIKVIAVDRRTGGQVLLLYENIAVRAEPVAVVRFE